MKPNRNPFIPNWFLSLCKIISWFTESKALAKSKFWDLGNYWVAKVWVPKTVHYDPRRHHSKVPINPSWRKCATAIGSLISGTRHEIFISQLPFGVESVTGGAKWSQWSNYGRRVMVPDVSDPHKASYDTQRPGGRRRTENT